jgi:hypothetical protein
LGMFLGSTVLKLAMRLILILVFSSNIFKILFKKVIEKFRTLVVLEASI